MIFILLVLGLPRPGRAQALGLGMYWVYQNFLAFAISLESLQKQPYKEFYMWESIAHIADPRKNLIDSSRRTIPQESFFRTEPCQSRGPDWPCPALFYIHLGLGRPRPSRGLAFSTLCWHKIFILKVLFHSLAQ